MDKKKKETNQKPIQEQQQNILMQKNNQVPEQDNLFRVITGDSGEALQKIK